MPPDKQLHSALKLNMLMCCGCCSLDKAGESGERGEGKLAGLSNKLNARQLVKVIAVAAQVVNPSESFQFAVARNLSREGAVERGVGGVASPTSRLLDLILL